MQNRILKILMIIIIAFIMLSYIANIVLHRNYTRRINDVILNIIAVVQYEYPDVTDEELLNILNNQNVRPHNLEMYGISSQDIDMIANTRTMYNIAIVTNISITIFFGVAIVILLIIHLKNRKNKIGEIADYIREISKKNYNLKLDENDEDELSLLQNELYKITILLKEQSENAIKDKENVKDGVSDISHQLKTPLTSIMIGLDNLIDGETMDEETRREFLCDMRNQTENINFLITNILKLSRLDSNVVKFVKQEINAKELLDEALQNLENIANNKKIKIEINSEDDVVFTGDYKWQLEAITNIIKNSIEHLNENGTLKISYRKLSVYTEIMIEDNGKGIDPKDLKHIFERFYKGKNSSSDSFGIGLSLSKKIIENDNGYITAKSQVGKGTTFIIRYMC
ncbi:MAG: HAMP domain-containing histidine kinase [Oscillospiraceae bacterium]|nr:HAMP domain-containing histidine kinase [Oscillospiraceae bacterium]